MGLLSKLKSLAGKSAKKQQKKKNKGAVAKRSTASSSVRERPKAKQPSRGSGSSASGRSGSNRGGGQKKTSWAQSQKAQSNRSSGAHKRGGGQSTWMAYVKKAIKSNNDTWKKNQLERQKMAGKTNAAGGRAKTRTGTWGSPIGKAIGDVAAEATTRTRYTTGVLSEVSKQSKQAQKKWESQSGRKLTKNEKRQWLDDDLARGRDYLKSNESKKELGSYIKQAKKANPVDGGTYKSKELNNSDITQLQNAMRLGPKYGQKALGDKLSRKIGSATAYEMNKNTRGRVVSGILQGLSYGDTIGAGVGKYGKGERKAIQEAKESGAYNLGYGAGMMGSFALSGTSGLGKAVAQGMGKGAAKAAAKGAAKNAAEQAAKQVSKSARKKFIQNRIGELAAETPLNITDAAKMSVDENGKVDVKKFAGYMGLNTALTGGMGAVTEGAGIKLTRKNVNDYLDILKKEQKGIKLTDKELAKKVKLKQKIDVARKDVQSAKSNTAEKGFGEGQNIQQDIRTQRRHSKAINRQNRVDDVNVAERVDDVITGRMKSGDKLDVYNETPAAKKGDDFESRRQQIVNRGRNRATQKYVDKVTEKNRQYINDRELTNRNADIIANSDDPKAGISNEVPDSTKLKDGVTIDKKQAGEAKKNVRENLIRNAENPTKYTDAEIKDIDDSVDQISDMLHNGNVTDARAEARRVARKYGQVDESYTEFRPEIKDTYSTLKKAIKGTVFHVPREADGYAGKRATTKRFREFIADENGYTSGNLKLRQSRNGRKEGIDIDDWWDDYSKQYPEIFDPELNSPEAQFRVINEIAGLDLREVGNITEAIPYEDIERMYDDLADAIFEEAEKNAGRFNAKSDVAKAMPREDSELDVINNELERLKEHRQTQIDNGAKENYVKDLDEEIEALTKRRDELSGGGATKNADSKVTDPETGEVLEGKAIDDRIAELNEAREKERAKARQAVAHKKNAYEKAVRENGSVTEKDQAHLDELQKQADEADARRDEIDNQIAKIEAQRRQSSQATKVAGEPEAFQNITDSMPKGLREGTPQERITEEIKRTQSELDEVTEKYGKDSPRAKAAQEKIDDLNERLEDAKHEAETGQKTQNTSDPVQPHEDAKLTLDEPRTRFGKSWRLFYRFSVDSFADVERLAKKVGGEKGQRLLAQTNAVRNAKNIAANWITGGRTNWNREKTGESLDAIFKKIGKKGSEKREDFMRYCYLKHNVERLKNDVPISGMPQDADETLKAIAELEEKYASKGNSALKELQDFQEKTVKYADDLLQYKVDAGIVTKSEAEKLRAYKNYIPTFTNKEFTGVVEEAQKTGINVDRGLKRAVGGNEEDQLVDLYDQLAQSTRSTMKHCEMNEMIRMVGDIQGVNYSDLSRDISPDDMLENSLFTSKEGGQYTATYYDADGAHTIKIPEEMYKGIAEWSGEEKAILINNKLTKAFSVPGRMFKNLVTGWNVIFAVRNGVRDAATALTYTKDLRGFAKAYPKALQAMVTRRGPYYDAYIAAGGKFSSLTKSGGADGFISTLENSKLSPLHYITEFNDTIETMPRMMEFISTIDKSGGIEGAGKEVIDRAMRNANDVTLNFGRSGIGGRMFNSGFVPYLNPSIQGLDKLARVFTEAKQERNFRGLIGLGMKLGAFSMAPSVFNEYMLRNDEDYQQLNTRDKDSNYFIPIGDGKFIKVPKARELVVVAEPAQYFFRHAQFGDSGGFKQMFQSAVDNIGVVNPLTDNMISPIIRMMSNKTWFGGDIESAYEVENLLPQDRYDEGTSLFAIALAQKQPAKALRLSPKKIDNLIDSYTGVIGDILLPMNAPAAKGNPVINKFVTDSVFSNKLSTETWDRYNELKMTANSKSLDPKKAQLAKYKQQDLYNGYLADTVTLNAAVSDIQADKNLTKAQKHDLVRELKKSMNELYRASKDGKVAKLDGKEVDSLNAIYNLYRNRKDTSDKAVGIAFKYADKKFQETYGDYKESDEYKGLSAAEKKRQRVKYLKYVVGIRSTQGKIGGDKNYINYKGAAVVGAMQNVSDGMKDSFGLYKYTIEAADTYKKKKYDLKHFVDTERISFLASRKLGLEYQSKMQSHDISMAQATKERDDGSYFIGDKNPKYQVQRMPAARYLVKTNAKQWTTQRIHDFADKYDYSYESDYEEVYKKAKQVYGKKYSDKECAAIAQVITNAGDNDFGDTSQKNDSGIFGDMESAKGGSGGRRRRRGRRGGRRGGRGGGGSGSSSGADWYQYVDDLFGDYTPNKEYKAKSTKLKDYSHASRLTEAYRNKAKKKQVITKN